MVDKKPINPKTPVKRSVKAARKPAVDAALAPTEPLTSLLQKTMGARQVPGLLSLLSGGLLAGSLGFFAAILFGHFYSSDPLVPLLNAQSELYEKLEIQATQIEKIQARPVLMDLSSTLAALGVSAAQIKLDIKALWAAQAEQFKAVSQRIDVLEKRPMTQAVSSVAIAAYERELAQLRADVGQVASYASTKVKQAKAMAEVLESKTVKLSNQGAATGALNNIWMAVESGVSFEGPLADLAATTDLDFAPSLIENASIGVVSLIVLQSQFLAAARPALKLARQENGPQEGESRILAFLKTQLGVRSLKAKDGVSADAILSRALQAVDGGNLGLALSEIAGLPESSKALLQVWSKAAGRRLRVLTALQKLSNALAAN